MLDAVTLDQLRTFIAAADQGSFSGAGRKLRRAQSVVSKTLANLEGQFGVKLLTARDGGRCSLLRGRCCSRTRALSSATWIYSRPKRSTWPVDSRLTSRWSSRSCSPWQP